MGAALALWRGYPWARRSATSFLSRSHMASITRSKGMARFENCSSSKTSSATAEQIRIAHAFNEELWGNPDDDEEAVRRRVAGRLRVRRAEVDEACVLVMSDDRLRDEMTQLYNASHGLDRRGNRIR